MKKRNENAIDSNNFFMDNSILLCIKKSKNKTFVKIYTRKHNYNFLNLKKIILNPRRQPPALVTRY